MGAFFFAMALYPEVQKKAQLELDSVVGSERLPEFSDRPSLSYLNALVKELLRWHPALSVGVPHRAIADDEYNGCLIPGGASVFVNIWFVHCVLSGHGTRLTSFIGPSYAILRCTLNLTISYRNAF